MGPKGLAALIIVASLLVCYMILVPPTPPVEEKVPLRLELTVNPTTVGPGKMVDITVRLLDSDGNFTKAESAIPVALEFRFEGGGSVTEYFVIPAGSDRKTVSCGFDWPNGLIIVEARSRGLIHDTTSITVV